MFFNDDKMLFNIVTVICWQNPDGVAVTPPGPYAHILLRRTGRCVLRAGETSFVSEAGCVTFMPAGEACVAAYQGSSVCAIRLGDCNYRQAENVRLHQPAYIGRLFEELHAQWKGGCSANAAKSGVYQLLDRIAEDHLAGADAAFRVCSLFMQAHYADPKLRMAEICRAGGVSETGLYRQFMACCGMSPKQYLLKLRLNAAAEGLLHEGASVQEIAWSCGFGNVKHFSRIFRERFGVPPSRYRQLR